MLTTREMSIHWVNSENLLTHDAFHQVDGQRLSDARIDQVVVRQKNDVGPGKNKLVFWNRITFRSHSTLRLDVQNSAKDQISRKSHFTVAVKFVPLTCNFNMPNIILGNSVHHDLECVVGSWYYYYYYYFWIEILPGWKFSGSIVGTEPTLLACRTEIEKNVIENNFF
jgi:hypothetical protein